MMWNNQNQNYSYPYNNFNNYLNQNNNNPYNFQQPNQSQQLNNQSQNNIIWVKGKENARSMQLKPNSTVILLDSQSGKFYIKTTDDIGLGKLRVFNYTEQPDQNIKQSIQITPNVDLSNYVTKEELENKIKEFLNQRNEQSVSTIKSATKQQF